MNGISTGLKNSLNKLREISSDIYTQYVPIIDDDTAIGEFAEPILNVPQVMNEFISSLVNRIVYTQFNSKMFNNPLKILEGDKIPLGYAGQEIYVNPAKGRGFNTNDFVGLLQKYEADVKVQYLNVNTDLQYAVSVTRHKLKQAFVSWEALDSFISNITQSLYNGAYIDAFNLTKGLVSSAYAGGNVVTEILNAPTTEELGKAFITKARNLYLNMTLPSTKYNAWNKVGGEGRPITTWSEKDDIVFLIRNDILSYIDVNVLASAFNIDKSSLMGNIIAVDNFDVYSTESGKKVFDGSDILGLMADKSWFKIKEQDMYMDEFYNANNRVWNYYLNVTKMYEFSLFANAVVFATKEPGVSKLSVENSNVNVNVNETNTQKVKVIPKQSEITSQTDNSNADAKVDNNETLSVTGKTSGSTKVTLKSGEKSTDVNVTIKE